MLTLPGGPQSAIARPGVNGTAEENTVATGASYQISGAQLSLRQLTGTPQGKFCTFVTAFRFISQLIIVLLSGWLLAYWPASLLHRATGVFWLSIAAAVMLASGLSGLILVWLFRPQNSIVKAFLHSGNRTLWVLVAVIFAKTLRPQLGFSEFYGWLIFFYVQLMILEVLALKRSAHQNGKVSGSVLPITVSLQLPKSSSEAVQDERRR